MTPVKPERTNLERNKSYFLLMGLTMALSLIYISFEWSKTRIIDTAMASAAVPDEGTDLIPITMTQPTPPPPPPPAVAAVEEIRIVDIPVETGKNNFIEAKGDVVIPPAVTTSATKAPVEDIPDIVVWVEEMPEFKGNVNEYLSKVINYPTIAVETGTQGKVYCEFVVNTDGSITDVKVVRGVDRSLDNEAMRVIKSMPKWKPGRMNGKAVRVRYTLPVVFKLM